MRTKSVAIRPNPIDATPYAHNGIRWRNSLRESERRKELLMSNSAVPADAYWLYWQLMREIHGQVLPADCSIFAGQATECTHLKR
jgi:hypothetical protein